MKYMLMLLATQADYDAMNGKASPGAPVWSRDELRAMFRHMEALNDDLVKSGEWVDGQGLDEPSRTRLVTADADGRPAVSEGPYGEAKEFLAGYWVVNCESPERAYEIAARAHACPVPAGTAAAPPVIVRPVPDAPPGPA